jgi:hypothetical protein
VDAAHLYDPADVRESEVPIREVADPAHQAEEKGASEVKRLWCWLFGHDTFDLNVRTAVCRRCFRWWGA